MKNGIYFMLICFVFLKFCSFAVILPHALSDFGTFYLFKYKMIFKRFIENDNRNQNSYRFNNKFRKSSILKAFAEELKEKTNKNFNYLFYFCFVRI